jgi:TRAP-type transport system periplasmic protein
MLQAVSRRALNPVGSRVLGAAVALALSASSVTAQAQSAVPAGPKITITAVTQLSPTFPQWTRVDVPMLRDMVPKATGGRIEFNLKTYPEMNVQGPEVIRLVRSGQVDVGAAPLTTVSGDVPLLDAFDLPNSHSSPANQRKAANGLFVPVNKEMERLGVRLIATHPFPAQVFFCKKPIAKLDDIKGLKVRVAGPSQSDFISALGGQPTAIAFNEVYGALERGTVDCAVTGTGSGNAQKWYEVTTHLYTLVVSWGISGYFVNLNWWNKLDAPVRTYLDKHFDDVEDAQWKLGAELTADGIACNIGDAAGCKINTLVKNKPMVLVRPTDADIARAKQVFVDVVLPNWVKRCGGEKCSVPYNDVVAPINGVRFTAR